MVNQSWMCVVFLLKQPIKYLHKTVIVRGMTVRQVKQQILSELSGKSSFTNLPVEKSVLIKTCMLFLKRRVSWSGLENIWSSMSFIYRWKYYLYIFEAIYRFLHFYRKKSSFSICKCCHIVTKPEKFSTPYISVLVIRFASPLKALRSRMKKVRMNVL